MKDSVAYKTLDNITVVLIAFNNFKQALADEFQQANYSADNDDSGQVGGGSVAGEDQRAPDN